MWSHDPEADVPRTGTEVVAMNDMARPEIFTQPVVGSVTKSTNVHIGPKIYKITHNVDNTEMLKGHIRGLEFVSPAKANRLRCSVAVFVCWTLLVAFGLSVYLFLLVTRPSLEDTGLNATWYFRRDDWQALPMYGQDFLKLPLSNVVIGHTGWKACEEKYSCIDRMMECQRDNIDRGFLDIVPNFLVGGDGLVFEGRGANVQAAMAKSWNVKSITVMFIGDFRTDQPNTLQFEHVNILLEQLVKIGVLAPDFVLYGQCQLAHNTIPPGPNIVSRLDELLHWNNITTKHCLH